MRRWVYWVRYLCRLFSFSTTACTQIEVLLLLPDCLLGKSCRRRNLQDGMVRAWPIIRKNSFSWLKSDIWTLYFPPKILCNGSFMFLREGRGLKSSISNFGTRSMAQYCFVNIQWGKLFFKYLLRAIATHCGSRLEHTGILDPRNPVIKVSEWLRIGQRRISRLLNSQTVRSG